MRARYEEQAAIRDNLISPGIPNKAILVRMAVGWLISPVFGGTQCGSGGSPRVRIAGSCDGQQRNNIVEVTGERVPPDPRLHVILPSKLSPPD
ncbi:caspase [Echinococcus multilocularis]|uniref:Caspase n=1 Tax=Echinococcus multilocularis TaxID=6211 RepID=A0A0S4MMT5_ECHMU|nr:caspase [Echinococcus multilocularis]